MKNLKKNIKKEIIKLGFDSIGYSEPYVDEKTKQRYKNFLNKNYHGDMKWLERHFEKKTNPKKIWDKVETIIVLGQNYGPKENPLFLNKDKNHGNISIYAQDEDYHFVIKNKLQNLQDWFKDKYNLETKIFVDTSPIMEKYFAEKAGLGWQGKHTNIVSKSFGSWLFLAEIFLPIKINETKNMINGCGSCVKCLEICPTNAILSNYKIDSKRCISYLTIENKGPIPMSLRKLIGNKIYGCDDCLSICPWNKFATETDEKKLTSNDKNNLLFFLKFSEEHFKTYFHNSSVKRIGWNRFLRNIIIASGNSKNKKLIKYILNHINNESSLVRGACVWSLFQLMEKKSKERLKSELIKKEKNNYVLYELKMLS